MKCSTLPLLTRTRANKMTPLHVGHQLHPQFQVLQQWVIETANRVGGEVCALFELPFNGGTPLLIFPRTCYFAQRAAVKPSIFFSHFHGLLPDAKHKHLESFVKLGTHCEPRGGEMSHICDIGVLMVNSSMRKKTSF